MRLTALLLTVAIVHVHASGSAQNISISEKKITYKQVFSEIEKQTGYVVFYNPVLLPANTSISLSVNQLSLQQFLDVLLKSKPLTYDIQGKTIFILKKEPVTVSAPQAEQPAIVAEAPPHVIRVTDSLGKPLPGASVQVKNSKLSGITDANGRLSLDLKENDVIAISFIGHNTRTIHLTASMLENGDLEVTLLPSRKDLNEVEIAINTGYQKIRPEQSTGSVYTLTQREYESRINTTDFLTGLQNKIPGLLINNDIQFEGNSLFQIRGISTIRGNKQPLIVVDGYPTELSLDMIDPNEIESVTVLRDAAAATIYGARSSNGVIIVERKKAKAGKMSVSFRGTTSFRPEEDYSRYRWDKNGSSTFMEYDKLRYATTANTAWSNMASPSVGYQYNYSASQAIMAHWRSGTSPITLEERDRQMAELGKLNNTDQYSRLFTRTAITQTYNLDMSGGSDRVLYYLTANFNRNDATQIKNNNNQFRLSGRSTMKLSDRFSLELTTDIQQGIINAAPVPDIKAMLPYDMFLDVSGNPVPTYYRSGVNTYYNDYLLSQGLLDNRYYPLQEVNEVNDKTRTLTNRITGNFRYNIGGGFNLSFGGVYESFRKEVKHMADEFSAESRQYVNRYTVKGANGLVFNIPKGAFLKQQNANTESYTARAQLNYDRYFLQDHSLNIILGGEVRDIIDRSNTASYFGYNDQTLFHQPVDYKMLDAFSPTFAYSNSSVSYSNMFGQSYAENRFISAYSNLVYSYKNKLSLSGSIRIDQSNLFGTDPKYRYKPLWSVGAAWNIHKESFMENLGWVNDLKLRVAQGFNGNVAKDVLPQVIAADGLNNLDPANVIPMVRLSSYANSGLRWEQTHNLNFGLDYTIFKNINGSIEYYIKKSTDILANNQVDATLGTGAAMINQASIRNNGLEISLRADWIARRKLNWNTGLIFSRNNSKVLDIYYGKNLTTAEYVRGSSYQYMMGYPVGAMFNFKYAGLNNAGAIMVYGVDGVPKQLNYNTLKSDDVEYNRTVIPAYNLGLSNRVDIGNFYVYAMINYFGGFNVKVPVANLSSLTVRPLEGANNYWRKPGDEVNKDLLPALAFNLAGDMAYSDKYVVNGAYITLGDVTVSYSLRNSRLLKKTGLGNVEVRAQASNLYTKAFNRLNYSVGAGPYEKAYITPTYSLNLNINF